jgi:aarF domain-containing kinase
LIGRRCHRTLAFARVEQARISFALQVSRCAATTVRATSTYGRIKVGLLITVGGGTSYLLYSKLFALYLDGDLEIWRLTSGESCKPLEKLPEVSPPEAFEHPHRRLPWYRQVLLTARRIMYLTYLFVPCTAVSAAAYITNSDRLREYSIRLLVRTFEQAGCSFLKFGQWMSMRPDMIPADFVEALKTLCDASPEHEFSHTRRIIQESFGRDIEDIFESFDELPVASGSVAQVHRARLKSAYKLGDGTVDVAVKVRHPSVADETFVDLDILYVFCDALARFTHIFTVPFDREDFSRRVQTQIDFKWEAYNLRRFANNFRKEVKQGTLIFPSLSKELLSPSILVESWASGNAMSQLFSKVGDGFVELVDGAKDLKKEWGEKLLQKKAKLAETLFDLQMKMILRDNHAHGDLHGGNVMYNGQSNTITVLDAGMATSLGEDVLDSFQDFLVSMAEGNAERMTDLLLSFVDKRNSTAVRDWDAESFRFFGSVQSEVDKWIDKTTGKAPDGGPISIGDLMGGILFKMNYHGLSLRGDIAGQMISFSITEGLIRQLDPPFDVVSSAKPYLLRYGQNRGASPSDDGFVAQFTDYFRSLGCRFCTYACC